MCPDGQTVVLDVDQKTLAARAANVTPWALLDDYADHYGVNRFSDTVDLKQIAEDHSGGAPYLLNIMSPEVDYDQLGVNFDDLQRQYTELSDYITTNIVQLILNAETDEEFAAGRQEIRDALQNMGYDDWMEGMLKIADARSAAIREVLS